MFMTQEEKMSGGVPPVKGCGKPHTVMAQLIELYVAAGSIEVKNKNIAEKTKGRV